MIRWPHLSQFATRPGAAVQPQAHQVSRGLHGREGTGKISWVIRIFGFRDYRDDMYIYIYNVGVAIINHPFLMAHTTQLW